MLASSRSRRNLLISASRFLLSSIWADVAPPASSNLSPSSSSSRAKSARCFSAFPRAWRSASTSSSSSSIRL
uniref:Putative secreted protein n=1 Tax=Panstrongylus lignarius TaxID=156445 RepID=A0A224XXR0_9HEMI